MNEQGSIPRWDGSQPDRWDQRLGVQDPWGVPRGQGPNAPNDPWGTPMDRTIMGPGQPAMAAPILGPKEPSLIPTVLVTVLFGVWGLIPAILASNRLRQLGRRAGKLWGAFAGSLVASSVAPIIVVAMLFGAPLPFGTTTTRTSADATYAPPAPSTTSYPVATYRPSTYPPTTTPPTTRPPASFPAGAQACPATDGPVGGFYSPVTEKSYAMTCSGSGLVSCTGGTNAVVYLI